MSEPLDEARMLQRIASRDQRAFEALVEVLAWSASILEEGA